MDSNKFIKKKKQQSIDFETIFYLFIFIVFVGVFTYIYFTNKNEMKLLDKYGVATQGKIIDKQSYKRGYRFKYSYIVDNNKYTNGSSTNKYIEIGENYEIIYYPENPEISKINLQKKIKIDNNR